MVLGQIFKLLETFSKSFKYLTIASKTNKSIKVG